MPKAISSSKRVKQAPVVNNESNDEALSVAEFFDSYDVDDDERKWFVKECTAASGDTFQALALNKGTTFVDAQGNTHSEYSFFALSKKLSETEELSNDWVIEHADDIRLYEREDKIGTIFLARAAQIWGQW